MLLKWSKKVVVTWGQIWAVRWMRQNFPSEFQNFLRSRLRDEMVQYKVTYFDGRGVGELIRQVLTVAEQDFEDVRYTDEQWPKHKAEMPFGQLPVLEIDGKKLAQSFAIARFLARKYGTFSILFISEQPCRRTQKLGFAGKNAFDEALVDSIADQLRDYVVEIRPFYKVAMGFEEGDLTALTKDVYGPARDKMFTIIRKLLKNSKSGYLVGDSLTWADLYLAEFAEFAKKVPSYYEGFPEVILYPFLIRPMNYQILGLLFKNCKSCLFLRAYKPSLYA
ncbi:unnamed protein product [Heligmosomoides polygyrus]|uniref:glutathione transferase n=1 Tax=Heligmosomoides polygyrus TaxID=6339 RepID=A0A3P7ZTZ4_HELPZ|nr:unnamed protein product [Heligmosomoides polygyrus]